jgi:glycosyltransferase involved in cell wall biosynthesis
LQLVRLDLLDEVWVPSAFCQQAIAAKAPIPVLRIPHSVEAPSVTPDRRAFDIGERDVAFLAMCDVLSVPERKNPLGAVDAFRRAFPGDESVRLLVKLSNLEHQPDLKSRLLRLLADDPRITLIEGYLARQELWTLIASIDCFVSLHRSEGFGLGIAEAMACARTVIATGWSGNVDFTRPDNALLVEYNLVELARDLGPYRRGQRWAEPDLDAAAHCMRQAAASAELRERLGVRARQAVARDLSPAAIAPMVRTRVEAIVKWR